ncbi:hypothetical protein F66182_9532 [Fusarium sp. NRRL 66182]|nr:hypothetical protein F66182_9532 [Fusarium sp. NRRL 66182]
MASHRAAEKQQETVEPLHIASNPYATSYKSTWTLPGSGFLDPDERDLVQNLNCSYFSSGRAPTLLALKKHAQSLVNIIRKLAPSSGTLPVGTSDLDDGGYEFEKNEAFDWLNNLDVPYENDDPSHHDPLWALKNTVKTDSETDGVQHHCPLTRVEDTSRWAEKGATHRPYMTHHDLVMHANECLEILDHEYSSTGGLMSILPIEDGDAEDKNESQKLSAEQIKGARNSILGQWLLHHQHLVARMHELEINYANAIDLLAGEAIIPHQILRRSGTDGISGGHEIAYPQDRYVLTNAGDHVTGYIHRLIDVAEAQIEQKEKLWKASGVSGERMWLEERGGKVYAKGIVPIDLLTRFYRIKGKGHQSPLFVIPAAEQHPGVRQTRLAEERPTVVSVVTPTWPERVSNLEAKNRDRLDKAERTDALNRALVRDMAEMKDVMAVKDAELKRLNEQLAAYQEGMSQ